MRKLVLVVATAAVLTAAVAACGSSAGKADRATTTSFVPATIASTIPVGMTASVAVGRLLVTNVPAGFVVQPDAVADTGPQDLEAAVNNAGGTAQARAFLLKNQYLGGFEQLWSNAKKDDILISIDHFAGPSGAAAQDATVPHNDSGQSSTPFVVPGIPGGKGFVSPDVSAPAVVEQFTKGGYAVQVSVVEPDNTPSKALATSLAQAQYAALP